MPISLVYLDFWTFRHLHLYPELCFFGILHPHPKGAIVLLVLIPADVVGVIEESRLVLPGLDVITL